MTTEICTDPALIRAAIIAHIRKTGACPSYQSAGTDYRNGKPVFDAMFADGTIVWATRISPKGRKMQVIRLAETED